jgi:glucosamine--fructose-6-phosphate aminotransferase (isomerizing)
MKLVTFAARRPGPAVLRAGVLRGDTVVDIDHALVAKGGAPLAGGGSGSRSELLTLIRAGEGAIDAAREAALSTALTEVPSRAAEVLNNDEKIQEIAAAMLEARDVLYLGRGTAYPLALEGALKLKEISYIHAEGYAAGEMKHGPIALIDEKVPIIVLAPPDDLFEKTASNVQESMARGGKVIMISDEKGLKTIDDRLYFGIPIPHCDAFVAPILYSIPIQLLAYHIAVLKGTDVDQPRNLAKSVTVE